MKKTASIILIALTVLLMIVNFSFAVKFHGEDGANLFTTASGWISGIATIVLGVIALYVNAQYKKENDNYLSKQDELAWKNEERNTISLYREQVIKCYDRFISDYNYTDLLYQLLCDEEKPEAPIKSIALLNKIQSEQANALYSLVICRYYFDTKGDLFETYHKYLSALCNMINDYKPMIYDKEQFSKADDLQFLYAEVIRLFNLHISEINVFLSAKLFVLDGEQISKMLNDMRKKQLEWWENVKVTENN